MTISIKLWNWMILLLAIHLVLVILTIGTANGQASSLADFCRRYEDPRSKAYVVTLPGGRLNRSLNNVCRNVAEKPADAATNCANCYGGLSISMGIRSLPQEVLDELKVLLTNTCIRACAELGKSHKSRKDTLETLGIDNVVWGLDLRRRCIEAWTSSLKKEEAENLKHCTEEIISIADSIYDATRTIRILEERIKNEPFEKNRAAMSRSLERERETVYGSMCGGVDPERVQKDISKLNTISKCVEISPDKKGSSLDMAQDYCLKKLEAAKTAKAKTQEKEKMIQELKSKVVEKYIPRITGILSFKKNEREKLLDILDTILAYCANKEQVNVDEIEIKKIKMYARRHGVFDKQRLYELSEDVQGLEEATSSQKKEIERALGRRILLSRAVCSRLQAVNLTMTNEYRMELQRITSDVSESTEN